MNLKKSTEGGNFVEKSISVGNVRAKIDRIELTEGMYQQAQKPYIEIALYLETEPVEGGGWSKTKENPNDKYEGASAKVKAGQFSFTDSDFSTRQDAANKFIQNIVIACGKAEWWDKMVDAIESGKIKIETPEELVNFINKSKAKTYEDVFLNWCIAGSEYANQKGEIKMSLFLAKYDSVLRKKAYSLNEDDVVKFDPTKHIIKAKVAAPVQSFTPVNTTVEDTDLGDFEMDDLDDLDL